MYITIILAFLSLTLMCFVGYLFYDYMKMKEKLKNATVKRMS